MRSDIVIRPVQNWSTLAANARAMGCPSVSAFILYFMLRGIHIPPTAMVRWGRLVYWMRTSIRPHRRAVYEGWSERRGN